MYSTCISCTCTICVNCQFINFVLIFKKKNRAVTARSKILIYSNEKNTAVVWCGMEYGGNSVMRTFYSLKIG